MTRDDAMARAYHRAVQRRTWVWVVTDNASEPGSWDTATECELDAYWVGARPIGCYGPDGAWENGG